MKSDRRTQNATTGERWGRVPSHIAASITRRSATARFKQEFTHLVLDEGSEGKVVEEVGEVSPYIGVSVLAETFVVEPVHLRDLPRFVVPAKDGHSVAVPQLKRNEESDSLDGVVASVDVVTHEEVVGIG